MNTKQKIIGVLILIAIYLLWKDNNTEHLEMKNNEDIYMREYTELKCNNDSEMYNGICYRKCKPGYEIQDTLCVKKCLGDLKETETHCLKNSPIFLGKEYDSLEDCVLENNNGCYKEGLKFYALCPKGKKQIGNFCADTCLGEMQDEGFGCLRTSYIKGIGDIKPGETCPKGTERIGDRCYKPCLPGYKKNKNICIKTNILEKK